MALYMDHNVPLNKLMMNPDARYRAFYKSEWFDDPEVVRIACEIDGLRHLFWDTFEHPVFGRCTGKEVSGGSRAVILAYLGETDDYVIPLSWLGENCFKTLGSLNIKSDVTFDGDYTPNLWNWECEFISKRTGNKINSWETYSPERFDYAMHYYDT